MSYIIYLPRKILIHYLSKTRTDTRTGYWSYYIETLNTEQLKEKRAEIQKKFILPHRNTKVLKFKDLARSLYQAQYIR